jgi:hypothetical protein
VLDGVVAWVCSPWSLGWLEAMVSGEEREREREREREGSGLWERKKEKEGPIPIKKTKSYQLLTNEIV